MGSSPKRCSTYEPEYAWKQAHQRARALTEQQVDIDSKEHLHLVYTPAYDPDANRHSMALACLAAGRDA